MALGVKREFSEGERKNLPLYPISVAAELLGTTDQTLRLYEKHGLINPSRRNKNRFYSENDIKWIKCLRESDTRQKNQHRGSQKATRLCSMLGNNAMHC